MNIKELTDQELRQELSKYLKYETLFYDKDIRKNYQSLFSALKSLENNAYRDIEIIKELIEEAINRKIMFLADVQFIIMERTKDYTDLGSQRVIMSYCRFVLDINPDKDIMSYDLETFRSIIYKRRKSLLNLSLDKLKMIEKKEKINILGRDFDAFQDIEINNALSFLASKKRITIGFFGKHRSIIFGDALEQELKDYKVFIQETETAITPTNCFSIAAIIGEKNITIRKLSLETIFYNKWLRIFNCSENESLLIFNNVYSNIRETIKQKSLEAYDVKTEIEFLAIKDLFIDEMVEGILWHEIGHGISMEDIEPEKIALGEAFNVFEDEMVSVLREMLADFALPKDELKGPLYHFAEIALKEKNYQKAKRLILVYISDNWFLDMSDDFMADQTDLICPIIFKYFDHNLYFDFQAFANDLKIIYQDLMSLFLEIIDNVAQMIKNSKYLIKNISYDFDELKKMLLKIQEVERDEFTPPVDTVQYKTNLWANILNYVQLYANDTYQDICMYIREKKGKLKKDVFNKYYPQEIFLKYNGNIRAFLLDKSKELGFWQDKKDISCLDAIKIFTKECFIPNSAIDKTIKIYENILDNKLQLNIKDLKDEKYHYFLLVLNEIVIRGHQELVEQAIVLAKDKFENIADIIKEIEYYKSLDLFTYIKKIQVNNLYFGSSSLASLANFSKEIELAELPETELANLHLPNSYSKFTWKHLDIMKNIKKQILTIDKQEEFNIDKLLIEKIVKDCLAYY